MRLHTLTVENFRQFRGPFELIFAGGDSSGGNVTVIYGENGRGKTGIFRAIMFCLYGDTRLAQDEEAGGRSADIINLVNEPSVRQGNGDRITARVELEFSHAGSTFVLKRDIHGMMGPDGDLLQELGSVRLEETEANGNSRTPVTDDHVIRQKIDSILDRRIKDYFLFDGERIERLTRNTQQQRKEVQKGVRSLLSIDAVGAAIDGLRELLKTLKDEVRKSTTGDLERILIAIDQLEGQQIVASGDISRCESELMQASAQLGLYSDQIERIETVTRLEQERREKSERKKDLEGKLSAMRVEMRDLANFGGLLISGGVAARLEESIDARVEKGELPPDIKVDFVRTILDRLLCICGRGFQEGDLPHHTLLAYINQQVAPSVAQAAMALYGSLKEARATRERYLADIGKVLQGSASNRDEMELLGAAIKQLTSDIDFQGGDTVGEVSKARADLEARIHALQMECATRKQDLTEISRRLESQERERKRLEGEQQRVGIAEQKRDLVQEAISVMNEIRSGYERDVRGRLQAAATAIFNQLADSETRVSLKEIEIAADYTLNVINWAGRGMLGDISAGQRQIVSLAFIAGLIETAGGTQYCDMPLFMDTPFGRLSGAPRDALLTSIPKLATQWILLATDTEFGQVEAEQLSSTGAWERLYLLEPIGPGDTEVRPIRPGEFQPKRRTAIQSATVEVTR